MRKVLIVDDEARILRFLELKLKVAGYDVVSAASGEKALTLARSEKPDIVLLDIIMPGIDGLEVLQEIRKFSQVPVIVFSARSGNTEKAMKLGANDYVAKPFSPDELIMRVNTLLPASD